MDPYPPTPGKPSPTNKIMKRVGIAGAFLVTLVVGISIGNSGDNPTPAASVAAPATATTAPPSITPYRAPSHVYSAPAAPAPAVETKQAAPAATTITNGTYEIGTEVQPGKYKSAGPESSIIPLCYVDVQRGKHYLAQETSNEGQVRIEIPASWKGALLEVSGCQPLVKQP